MAAIGMGEYLVGRSHECDFPEEVVALPVCSEPRYKSDGTSSEINKVVREKLEDALSIYTVDIDLIKSLRPTHIITQSQCEVCAVSTDELQEALKELIEEESVTVVDLNPESMEHIYNDMLRIASSLSVETAGEELIANMKKSFSALAERTVGRNRPSIAHIEWIDPIMVAGHWTYDLIEWAGGDNCFPDPNKRWIGFDELVQANPDKIVVAPCGFSIEHSLKEMHFLTGNPKWEVLRAVQNDEVFISDGHQYFNRSGPRLVDSAEILAEVYHADLGDKYRGRGWIEFEGK
ncbi:ABC transporter substrate-binding protein [Flavobacteriales bacterium AH-315-E23]|nr:ABC transporter substrate-binding protein [Flavobacteriales bacterium AH-315-E23]